jgi:hypothetical protein
MDAQRLEQLTCALNAERYAEAAGLPADQAHMARVAHDLGVAYQQLVDEPHYRDLALDGLAEALALEPTQQLDRLREATLVYPPLGVEGEAAAWHNWKRVQRALADQQDLRRLFSVFVEQSQAFSPLISQRYAQRRELYAHYGTTPLEVFARREQSTPQTLRSLAIDMGDHCREAFRQALARLAHQVFGAGEVSFAELQALYLNRMYEPLATLFASRDGLADIRANFGRLGFSIDTIAMDFEDRPQKYAGAFCYPVKTPGDVRVSVRPASPHHLTDMLFHEFGHAVHFSGIDPALPFADRYWIHSGTHETFATLFESLLGQPDFLQAALGFGPAATLELVAFDQFKTLVTATWLAATGAAVCDAWLDGLDWPQVEDRLANYMERFTSLRTPSGWARLDQFVSNLDPYPLGYLIAAVRVAHWLQELEAQWGSHWWADCLAGEAIRTRIRQGGAVRFEPDWLSLSPLLERAAAVQGSKKGLLGLH